MSKINLFPAEFLTGIEGLTIRDRVQEGDTVERLILDTTGDKPHTYSDVVKMLCDYFTSLNPKYLSYMENLGVMATLEDMYVSATVTPCKPEGISVTTTVNPF
jgi:hypothetical protein